ncbi:hypothetical protein STXM2123_2901 [Streptomyces sp. F-3]|nr:hypothetical protein STXM2123_2901 [Streptomyces sp. F-3]
MRHDACRDRTTDASRHRLAGLNVVTAVHARVGFGFLHPETNAKVGAALT